MIQPLIALAMVAVSALPPHPLNQIIGGRDWNQKPRRVEQVQENVLASPAFENMVKQAVAHAQDPRLAQCDVLKDLNFGQRVRIILGELFSNVNFIEEWQPVNLAETIMPNRGPEPPHALDRVIGERVRPSIEVIRALRESREVGQFIRRVAEQSEPLPRGNFGASYAETVRLAIADALLGNPKTAAEFNQRGDHYYNADKFDLALADYDQALYLDPKNAEAAANRGWVYYQQGDLDQAAKAFDDALKLDPQWVLAWSGRAYVYRRQQKYQQSINSFTKALDIEKDANERASLYNKRGDVYYTMNNYKAALADYTQSVKENPNKGRPHADSAWALYRLERYDEALEALDKAIALEPQKTEYWNLSGNIYRAQENFSKAIASHGKAVQLDPQDDDGWNELGVAHYAAGQFDEVVAALTKAIELNAKNQVYYRNRGDAYQQLGRHEQAVADFTRAIELEDTEEVRALRRRSEQALAEGKIAPTLVTVPGGEFIMGSSDWKTDSDNKYKKHEGPPHRVRISEFLLGSHEVTQAQWKAVMKFNPSQFSSQGEKKSKVKNINTDKYPVENVTWYEAVIFCNRLSERDGLKPYYRLKNEREEEFTFLGETKMLKRYDVEVVGGNGYRLPTEAEWEYACRAGTQSRYSFGDAANGSQANVSGEHPFGTKVEGPNREQPVPAGSFEANAFGLYDMHGNVSEFCLDERDDEAYSRRGKLTVDPVVARRVIVGEKNTTHIIRGGDWRTGAIAATSYYRTAKPPTSRSSGVGFRVARSKATDANPRTAAEFNQRGDRHYNEGKYDLALADYNRALELDPKNAEATANRGWVYYQQGDLDQAAKEFDDALKLDPQWMLALTGRAYVYHDQQKYQESINSFTKALDSSKDANQRADLYNTRGDVYYAMENYNAALADYTRSIKENPNDGLPHGNCGYALYQLERYDEAVEALDKALALEPKRATFWNLSGNAYYAQEKFARAIASYDKALQLNPGDAVYYSNRGKAYQHLGRHEQAVADFTRAIELEDTAKVRELRRRSVEALAEADACRAFGLTVESYAQLFLEGKDLPADLERVQDARNKGPDADDRAFEEHLGERCGFAAWLAKRKDAVVWRVVDVRFVFPNADAARLYMEESWPRLAEGAAESKDAPKVGDDCRVFGPENEQLKKLVKLGLAADVRAYTYVFRKHNVVVKLFVCQGPALAEPVLQPEAIVPLAQEIVARIGQDTRRARDYFPLPEGHVWWYDIETPEGIRTFEYDVRDKDKIDGDEYQWFVSSFNDRDTMKEAWRHTDQGLFLKQVGDLKFTPEWQMLPEPIQLGWQNKQELKVDDRTVTVTTSIAEKTEHVRVPAGEFNAIRLTTTLQTGDEKVQRDYWLAHGVGIVQLHHQVQGDETKKLQFSVRWTAAQIKQTEQDIQNLLKGDD